MMTSLYLSENGVLDQFLISKPEDVFSADMGPYIKETIAHQLFPHLDFTSFEVKTEAAYKINAEIYAKAREWKKHIEDRKKKLTEPYRRKVSEINEKASQFLDVLDNIICDANKKALDYVAEIEKKRRQREKELQEFAALLEMTEPVELNKVETRATHANLVERKTKKFRVLDITKVPSKYLTVSAKEVDQDIGLGVFEIPGLEIYEETTITLRKSSI